MHAGPVNKQQQKLRKIVSDCSLVVLNAGTVIILLSRVEAIHENRRSSSVDGLIELVYDW